MVQDLGVFLSKNLIGFYQVSKGGYIVQYSGMIPVTYILSYRCAGVLHLPGYKAKDHT